MPERYFGEKWDAPAFDDAVEDTRPTGDTCMGCQELIDNDDSGTWMLHAVGYSGRSYKPWHIECFLRMVLGSPSHLKGECLCKGVHEEEHDKRSYREQARETMRILLEQKEKQAAEETAEPSQ